LEMEIAEADSRLAQLQQQQEQDDSRRLGATLLERRSRLMQQMEESKSKLLLESTSSESRNSAINNNPLLWSLVPSATASGQGNDAKSPPSSLPFSFCGLADGLN